LIVATSVLSVSLLCGFSIFHKKKYETPITKETQQPDKILFDRAISNIEHGNYLAARLTLNTLINTYDTSEYLAKAKLAIADSWFREGDAHGLAQAEIEYKDFILFYPNMEEAAESQSRICDIHIKQMSKPDRDSAEGQRAEDECRQVIVQFPNSKFREQAEQKLRNIQEILAQKEMDTAQYYFKRGSLPAAQGRFSFVTQQYPLFSGTDEALWEEADAFRRMGDRFEDQEADALTRIVRDYPVSLHVAAAKNRLTAMKRPVPDADADAYKRMKYNLEHQTREGFFSRTMGIVTGRPDMGAAARQGAPIMVAVRPTAPVSVPQEAAGSVAAGTSSGTGVSDVGIGVVGNASALEQKTDARLSAQTEGEHKASVGSTGLSTDPTAKPQAPLPTNHPYTKQQLDALKKQQEAAMKAQKKAAAAAAKKGLAAPDTTTPPAAAPGTATPAGAASPATASPAGTPAAAQPAATPR
jgi:outer membrane protein assembly factor BamD